MKRFLCVVFAAVLSFSAFAKDSGIITVLPSIGFVIPYQRVNNINDVSVESKGFDFLSGDVIVVHNKTNIAIDGGFGVSVIVSDDIIKNESVAGVGLYGYLGLGYSFIRTDKQNLSLFAIIESDNATFEKKINYRGTALKYSPEVTVTGVGLHARYSAILSEHFGVTFGIRMIGNVDVKAKEKIENESTGYSVTSDLDSKNSGFAVYPRIGLTWLF